MRKITVLLVVMISQGVFALNPIITHLRTADPSAHVWADGKIWIYASHDQDNATDYSSMDGYHVFSSSDMYNWTDHGEVLHSRDVSWGIAGGGWMWAPDCNYKNGTYYFYFPHKDAGGTFRIGVATSSKPEGPFTDIGNYIQGTSGTDPACFIDDDGQAYLYFGSAKVGKLKPNMIELAEPARTVNYGASNFGEGAWMHKYNGKYYYSYTDFTDPVHQAYYSIGTNPYGPFEYKGPITTKNPPCAQDHHSIVEYKGQWYYFYHVGNYNGCSGNRRNVCVEYLYYNPDGTIQPLTYPGAGVMPVGTALPEIPMEAEDYTAMSGVGTESASDTGGGQDITDIQSGDWVEYPIYVPTAGNYVFDFRVASGSSGGTIKIVMFSSTVGSATVTNTDGWQTWTTVRANAVFQVAGIQTLRLKFSGTTGNLLNLNWFEYTYDPIKVEAENYTKMSGIGKETTSDTDGGQNIGWIENGDWAEYAISLPFAGSYTINFRVATSTAGGTIEMVVGGSTVGIAAVTNTGGFQSWKTITATATFDTAGPQTLRLKFVGGAGYLYNINWFDYFRIPATGDLNSNGKVNMGDFAILSNTWKNGHDMTDLLKMAEDWLID
jgi:arabinoxylan arabinofuranohydrolase